MPKEGFSQFGSSSRGRKKEASIKGFDLFYSLEDAINDFFEKDETDTQLVPTIECDDDSFMQLLAAYFEVQEEDPIDNGFDDLFNESKVKVFEKSVEQFYGPEKLSELLTKPKLYDAIYTTFINELLSSKDEVKKEESVKESKSDLSDY